MRYFFQSALPIVADLAGTIIFYLLFLVTGVAWLAASIGFAAGVAQLAWLVFRKQPVPALLMMGLALTAVLSALTILTNDARFVLFKPSIIYAAVGLTMLPRGWVNRYVPAIARELMPSTTFDWVGWGWAALMFATAGLNILLLAFLPPIQAAALFAIWAVASKVALFGGQYSVIRIRAGRAYARRAGTS